MTTTSESPYIVRDRISQTMAFPIGYEILREYFGALPHWIDARFSFVAHPTTSASEFARILRVCEPYRVLRVERCAERHVPTHQPAHWNFAIYPVPRQFKSIARRALLTGAFAGLLDFIAHAPTHPTYYDWSDAIFDPAAGICTTTQLWPVSRGT